MCSQFNRSLLVLVICMTLFPTVGSASSLGADAALNQSQQGVSDTFSGQTPQMPDIRYQDMTPAGGPSGTPGDPGSQATNAPPTTQKEHIKVVYDQETEKDRGTLITLIIAFGISLALNIYLATALISARKGMS